MPIFDIPLPPPAAVVIEAPAAGDRDGAFDEAVLLEYEEVEFGADPVPTPEEWDFEPPAGDILYVAYGEAFNDAEAFFDDLVLGWAQLLGNNVEVGFRAHVMNTRGIGLTVGLMHMLSLEQLFVWYECFIRPEYEALGIEDYLDLAELETRMELFIFAERHRVPPRVGAQEEEDEEDERIGAGLGAPEVR